MCYNFLLMDPPISWKFNRQFWFCLRVLITTNTLIRIVQRQSIYVYILVSVVCHILENIKLIDDFLLILGGVFGLLYSTNLRIEKDSSILFFPNPNVELRFPSLGKRK